MNEEKRIRLQHPLLGVREFGEQHAKNIMSIPASSRGGWEYADDDGAEVVNQSNESDAADHSRNSGNPEAEAKRKSGRNTKSGKTRK